LPQALRKRPQPIARFKPSLSDSGHSLNVNNQINSHAVGKYKDTGKDEEEKKHEEEEKNEEGKSSLKATEPLEEEEKEISGDSPVNKKSKNVVDDNWLTPSSQAPFKGVSRLDDDFAATAATSAIWKTNLSINPKSLLESDPQRNRSQFDSVSLLVYGCTDPTEAALIYDLTRCWKARRVNANMPTDEDLNFSMAALRSHPVTNSVLFKDVLGSRCAFAEQLCDYMQSLISQRQLLNILDTKARKTALEAYSKTATIVKVKKEKVQQFSRKKYTVREEDGHEVIDLVADDDDGGGEQEDEQQPSPAAAIASAAVEANGRKRKKCSTMGGEQIHQGLLTARKSAANAGKRAKPLATTTAPDADANGASPSKPQPEDTSRDKGGGVDSVEDEMRAFLVSLSEKLKDKLKEEEVSE
jgi:hypothetical protein